MAAFVSLEADSDTTFGNHALKGIYIMPFKTHHLMIILFFKKRNLSDIFKFHAKQHFLKLLSTLVSRFIGTQRLGQATVVFISMSISTLFCLLCSSLLAHLKN